MSRLRVVALAIISAGIVISFFNGCSTLSRRTETTSQRTEVAEQPSESGAVVTGTTVGNLAPDFLLDRPDAAPLVLKELRGQPVVLVFWTAWCPTCKEEAPHFNELAADYSPRGVHVIGINVQDSAGRTDAGVKSFGIRYAVVRDADAQVARRYQVSGTPTIVIIDKKGVVRYFANELPDDYAERLDLLLSES